MGIPRPSPGDGLPLLITGHMYQIMPYVVGLSGIRDRLGEGPLRALARVASRAPRILRLARPFADGRSVALYRGYLRNIASLLRAAGVEFAYDPLEPYPGTLLYELGHDAEFARYARAFADYLRGLGASRVITVDPHTRDLLAEVYPRYVEGFGVEVLHYADLLGGLELRDLGISVAYHEPCHFAVRDEPLAAVGSLLGRAAEVRYARRSGRRNLCCGGPAELLRGGVAAAVSWRRFAELKELGADLIVTACPICHVNLNKDGSVVDASEVLAAAAGLKRLRRPLEGARGTAINSFGPAAGLHRSRGNAELPDPAPQLGHGGRRLPHYPAVEVLARSPPGPSWASSTLPRGSSSPRRPTRAARGGTGTTGSPGRGIRASPPRRSRRPASSWMPGRCWTSSSACWTLNHALFSVDGSPRRGSSGGSPVSRAPGP